MEQELLKQNYTFEIYKPNFEGDRFGATLSFYKQIDSKNYLIDIEIEINPLYLKVTNFVKLTKLL